MNIRPLKDYVIVQIEKERQDEIKHGSLKLEAPVGWNEHGINAFRYAQTKGVVAGVPDSEERIDRELQVGDTVYFHYNAIKTNRVRNKLDIDGELYYRFFSDMIFVKVRDGVITPLNDRALCKPIFDDPDVEEIEIEGKMQKVKISEAGIITKVNAGGHNEKRAILTHIDPYHEEIYGDAVGKVIHYDRHADFEIEIEGEKFFVMLLEDISAVEEEE